MQGSNVVRVISTLAKSIPATISFIETSFAKAMTLNRNASGSETFLSQDVPLPFEFCRKIMGMSESLGITAMSLHRAAWMPQWAFLFVLQVHCLSHDQFQQGYGIPAKHKCDRPVAPTQVSFRKPQRIIQRLAERTERVHVSRRMLESDKWTAGRCHSPRL